MQCTYRAYPQNNKFTSLRASLAARVRGVKPMLFITVLSGFHTDKHSGIHNQKLGHTCPANVQQHSNKYSFVLEKLAWFLKI